MPQQMLRLEVVEGPMKGQVVLIHEHQVLVVGRLPECGLSFPQDLTVSRQHCRIEFDPPTCRLVHLSQTGETLVNRVSVSNIDLRSGDEIAFGAGNRVQVAFEAMRGGIGSSTVVPGQIEPSKSIPPHGFTTSTASCGWNLYESADEQPEVEQLLNILIASQQLSAVIDFRRIGLSPPPALHDPHYLFSWIQPPSRDLFSPVLVSKSNNPSISELILAGWGKDGIVCFGSKLEGADLAVHWRKAIGTDGEQPGRSMTAYFWPSILNLILTCQSSEQVAPLLRELTWLFVEAPKSPGKWRLFTKGDFVPELTKAKLVEVSTSVTAK